MAYDELFQKASDTYGVDVSLLKAVAKTESTFNPNATSKAGAMGLMQLMPDTAKFLGVTNAYDPEQNIMGGAKYLSQLLDQWGGDKVKALASYNAGPGNVKKYGAEKYSSYYTKVLENEKGFLNGESAGGTGGGGTSYPSGTSNSLALSWWGDIVAVIFLVLVILFGVGFLIKSFGGDPVKMIVSKGVKLK